MNLFSAKDLARQVPELTDWDKLSVLDNMVSKFCPTILAQLDRVPLETYDGPPLPLGGFAVCILFDDIQIKGEPMCTVMGSPIEYDTMVEIGDAIRKDHEFTIGGCIRTFNDLMNDKTLTDQRRRNVVTNITAVLTSVVSASSPGHSDRARRLVEAGVVPAPVIIQRGKRIAAWVAPMATQMPEQMAKEVLS